VLYALDLSDAGKQLILVHTIISTDNVHARSENMCMAESTTCQHLSIYVLKQIIGVAQKWIYPNLEAKMSKKYLNK
jgi:hypothetical protein